jgi:diaminohydroxyphosphoribosylaminopyrimidine deaminase/5-amino-6-(5-phosphoribosylamino)uracil reductase
LKAQGVEVISGILEAEGKVLAATRNIAVTNERPYIVLKMAITANGFFAPLDGKQFWITQAISKRLVHRWRMEADAILVGTATALIDDPQLDNRHYYGKSPLRIVLDRELKLPPHLNVLSDGQPTLLITEQMPPDNGNSAVQYLQLTFDSSFWSVLMAKLWKEYKLGVVLVEGGAKVLEGLIAQNLWDEARVFMGKTSLPEGIPAPTLPAPIQQSTSVGKDRLNVYKNDKRS